MVIARRQAASLHDPVVWQNDVPSTALNSEVHHCRAALLTRLQVHCRVCELGVVRVQVPPLVRPLPRLLNRVVQTADHFRERLPRVARVGGHQLVVLFATEDWPLVRLVQPLHLKVLIVLFLPIVHVRRNSERVLVVTFINVQFELGIVLRYFLDEFEVIVAQRPL